MQTSFFPQKSLANSFFLSTFAPQNLNTVKNMTTIIITTIQEPPLQHKGETLISYADNGGRVIIDSPLL